MTLHATPARRALSLRIAIVALALVCTALFGAAWADATIAAPAALVADPAPELTLWVSPSGSDSNTGLSPETPFRTLQRANDWLCNSVPTCPGRGQTVTIRLAQTTFAAPAPATIRATGTTLKTYEFNPGDATAFLATAVTVWNYFDLTHTTTFQPWNYQLGDTEAQVTKTGGYPTFDGGFSTDSGFVFKPLTAAGTGSTKLVFRYTKWQHYRRSAIVLGGGLTTTVTGGVTVYKPTAFTANGVMFYRNYFYQIGNYWHPANALAYGAILANNSSGDVYRSNRFVQLRNTANNSDTVHIHGLYISHSSNKSVVETNIFTDVTGDPVRQRDRSNATIVRNNTFTRAGAYGYFDDYFCRPNTPNSYCFPKEYLSSKGVFSGNTLKGLYPQGISGRRTVFCFDIKAGICPTNRIKVTTQ